MTPKHSYTAVFLLNDKKPFVNANDAEFWD